MKNVGEKLKNLYVVVVLANSRVVEKNLKDAEKNLENTKENSKDAEKNLKNAEKNLKNVDKNLFKCMTVGKWDEVEKIYREEPLNSDGYAINGRVKIGSMSLLLFSFYTQWWPKGHLSPARWIFFIPYVSAGTYLIEVAAIDYSFSPVQVDVSARNPGKIQAALAENRKGLTELVLEPLREEQYYEIREPFSIMSVLKSPMGLMMGFMLIVVFLMPKLMENIDTIKMKRAQEEMRNQGVPTLAGLISGAGRS
ncbi:ER membrane protein complex subunit 7 homolog [Malania oleifera]|uniref:ER membrane protein complex subunit 7 homolog n=1 Tax=Malania oleifera TaxID=397392 RepID=UPI0025ADE412|nr:ER membrane protein complex subunit 7 homolog [Malania oleifera]